MQFNPQKHYIFLSVVFAVAVYIYFSEIPSKEHHVTTCIFKNVTGYPCEFCGTGRSLIYIRHGHFYDSVMMNPLGFGVFFFVLISVIWIIKDLIKKKDTYFPAVNRKVHPGFIVFVIIFVIVNWIWNIYKDV